MRKNALSVKNFKMANMYTVSSVVERLDDFDFDLDDGLDSDFGREGVRSYLSRAGLDGTRKWTKTRTWYVCVCVCVCVGEPNPGPPVDDSVLCGPLQGLFFTTRNCW